MISGSFPHLNEAWRIHMQEPGLIFPVTCPECALESPFELPIALIANALLTGKGIRLHARCHDQYWTATFVEREQLRKTLGTMTIEARPRPLPTNINPPRADRTAAQKRFENETS
jgi:hypothetical protein